jgi:AcrR family transcriptional regulator
MVADAGHPEARPTESRAAEPRSGSQEARVIEAALRCIGRWGTTKTTIDDLAREAGCSRATIYRLLAGGKEAVLIAVARAEVERFFAGLAGRMEAAETMEDVLVAAITEAGRRIRDHAALQFLLTNEPETVVPYLAFKQAEALLGRASAFGAPYLDRWLQPADALRAAEWAARVVLSFGSCPAPDVDLADEASVRCFVATFMIPGLVPLTRAAGDTNVRRDS